MVPNVSFWKYGTGILQPKYQHLPQESHSSGPNHTQLPSAKHAIHSIKASLPMTDTPPQQPAPVQKIGSAKSQIPACGIISS